MDKKTYVLKVLNLISAEWPVAEGLISLLEKNQIDDELLDVLSKIFRDAVEKTLSDANKAKLGKISKVFEKIKTSEMEDQKFDEEDLQELEDMINAF